MKLKVSPQHDTYNQEHNIPAQCTSPIHHCSYTTVVPSKYTTVGSCEPPNADNGAIEGMFEAIVHCSLAAQVLT